ncbi:ketopantoate reductase-like protein [Phakopsora pachyrhizi]|uniref:Ketopantoate reductase-like protein n=1 Tax=Phakopsora pachyrhizi TaxID=170000 RepID=A0AAV0BH25_PHAPC|nr:ketopantoate reductase-like protein [Phakopsora pachyrhizi]
MRIHCVGPGSIGSLVCFHLQRVTPVTFLLRTRQPQHRKNPTTLSIQLEQSDHQLGITGGITYQFLGRQQQEPIDSLLVTTKAHQVTNSIRPIRHRLSRNSTLVLLHNGLGVLEELVEELFPDPLDRPSFVLATTSHGVHKVASSPQRLLDDDHNHQGDEHEACHGRFCHSGVGDLRFGVLPNLTVSDALRRLSARHYPKTESEPLTEHNPILNPASKLSPNLDDHLPYLSPATHSLHRTVASLLNPRVCSQLNTRWLPLGELQTSALIKLAVNASVNPISALLETRNSSLRGQASFNSISRQVCQEASAVFAAQLGKPIGPHHPLSAHQLHGVVETILTATASNISSMCADMRSIWARRIPFRRKLSKLNRRDLILANKRSTSLSDQSQIGRESTERSDRTEVDYINGYICKLGKRYGIDTRLNEALCNLVKLKVDSIELGEVLPRLRRINAKM